MVQTLRASPEYIGRLKQEQAQQNEVRRIDLVSLLDWTYGEQKAHLDIVSDDEPRHFDVRCALNSLEQLLHLRTFVDGGGRSCVELHPDAEAVHSAVKEFAAQSDDCAYAAGLLIYYGANRTQPEKPALSGSKLQEKRDRTGRTVMSYWRADGEELFARPGTKLPKPHDYDGPGCRVGQACELQVVSVESDLEEFLLETYTYWCAALEIISGALPMLKTHKLMKFQAPEFDRKAVRLLEMSSVA
ncbi:hypothetical protein PsW64_02368 [Pseudovibrio sp. W64]|uniref:hypothetical protein n=1 Tax=Pseudovibrio sp. W64 TaxID=1735583 RepID=UPI0007AED46D|nr:hypothetical protein [Pseudovibrio sp. W64]KZK81779.1 hypothetical protein PsW64_02368 [Pseudovibrio sp. W64]